MKNWFCTAFPRILKFVEILCFCCACVLKFQVIQPFARYVIRKCSTFLRRFRSWGSNGTVFLSFKIMVCPEVTWCKPHCVLSGLQQNHTIPENLYFNSSFYIHFHKFLGNELYMCPYHPTLRLLEILCFRFHFVSWKCLTRMIHKAKYLFWSKCSYSLTTGG